MSMKENTKTESKNCTKEEFVKLMARRCDMTIKETEKALKAFVDTVTEVVTEGKKITFVGFGSFECVHRNARQGRNPRTGEIIDVPASKSVKFGAGKILKNTVNSL